MKNKVFKKILFMIFVFLLSAPSFAFDWGIFDDYEDNVEDYALYSVIYDIPIHYAIEIREKNSSKQNFINEESNMKEIVNEALIQEKRISELDNLIKTAFNTWLTDTKNMIINEDREEEFEDIMPILNKKIKLKKVSDTDDVDVVFIFTSWADMRKKCGKASACIFRFKDPVEIYIVNPDATGLMSILQNILIETEHSLIHEIGHYFALTDQYKDTGTDSLEYSTFNRMNTKDAIMGSNLKKTLSCDDVDGFINLIDLTLYLENDTWSARSKEGWASFCNGKKNRKGEYYKDEFYKESKLINKPNYVGKNRTAEYDENGNIKKYTEATEWWTLESH